MEEYSSITEFLQSETTLSQSGATVTTAANGDTVVTARIRLADTQDEEAVDISTLTNQQIESLQDVDPFMYHSIVSERRRSSFFDFDDDACDGEDGQIQFSFDLQDIEGLGLITSQPRRASLRTLDIDDPISSGVRGPIFSQSDHINAENSHANGGSVHSGVVRVRSTAGGMRSGPDPADASAGSVHSVSVSGRVSSTARQQRLLSQNLQPRGPVSFGRLGRIGGGSFTTASSGSRIVARRRRFSTEAHSSLVMTNFAAELRGTVSPEMDSLFGDMSDIDLLEYLREG